MAIDHLALVSARREQIRSELALLEQRRDQLTAELSELDQVERTLSRLTGAASGDDSSDDSAADSRKPAGTPAVSQMILTLLYEQLADPLIDEPGLEPREAADLIGKRWWPGVRSEDVGPIMWRMWKKDRLGKNGAVYTLLKNKPADEPLEGIRRRV